jgi:aldose 1-epimerase
MSYTANIIDYKGKDVIELIAGKYRALIAPFVGSNVMRMQDTENDIEVFRYDENLTPEEFVESAEVYGMPTLYLPNRLSNGLLKVSDCSYHFPINDPLGNHLHGFLHKRQHTIVSAEASADKAVAKTEYIYDENDPFFETYPVSFKAEFTFTLSDAGLDYQFSMTNTSDRQLPFGVCNHTAFNGPFVNGAKGEDVRLYLPVGEKWKLDKHCIPTGEFLPMTNHEKQYLTGSQVPVLHDIDNDVFFAEEGSHRDKPFYGAVMTDIASGRNIVYEVSKDYKFWIVWNDHGEKGFFCPEPSTWIIDAPNLPIPDDETGYVELKPGESKAISTRVYTE